MLRTRPRRAVPVSLISLVRGARALGLAGVVAAGMLTAATGATASTTLTVPSTTLTAGEPVAYSLAGVPDTTTNVTVIVEVTFLKGHSLACTMRNDVPAFWHWHGSINGMSPSDSQAAWIGGAASTSPDYSNAPGIRTSATVAWMKPGPFRFCVKTRVDPGRAADGTFLPDVETVSHVDMTFTTQDPQFQASVITSGVEFLERTPFVTDPFRFRVQGSSAMELPMQVSVYSPSPTADDECRTRIVPTFTRTINGRFDEAFTVDPRTISGMLSDRPVHDPTRPFFKDPVDYGTVRICVTAVAPTDGPAANAPIGMFEHRVETLPFGSPSWLLDGTAKPFPKQCVVPRAYRVLGWKNPKRWTSLAKARAQLRTWGCWDQLLVPYVDGIVTRVAKPGRVLLIEPGVSRNGLTLVYVPPRSEWCRVPDVAGLTEAVARQRIRAAGCLLGEVKPWGSDVKRGTALFTNGPNRLGHGHVHTSLQLIDGTTMVGVTAKPGAPMAKTWPITLYVSRGWEWKR